MSFRNLEPIAITSENTVVAEMDPRTNKAKAYESESELEAAFIELLKGQAYEYLAITDEAALIANLKVQIEARTRFLSAIQSGSAFLPRASRVKKMGSLR